MFVSSDFENCIEAALTSPSHDRKSFFWNLLHDWRISDDRAREISAFIDPPTETPDADTLWRAFGACHFQTVQNPPQDGLRRCTVPRFVDETRNAANIYGHCSGPPAFADDVLLATITPMSKLWRIFQSGARTVPEFADYLDPASSSAPLKLIDWLDIKLSDLPATPRADHWKHPFLRSTLAYIGATLTELPYEPTWVALWGEFMALTCDDASRWQECVGVPSVEADEWLLLQVYPKSRAPTLVRPSQMDAGLWPAHFPQPPKSTHGIAMDFGSTVDCRRVAEFVHARADMRRWLYDPNMTPIRACVRVAGRSTQNLAPSQRAHLEALANQHGPLDSWIKHPHPATTSIT